MQGMMFADAVTSTWQERLHRGWTTLGSFAIQALIAAILLLIPILRTTGLPSIHQLSTPISIGYRVPDATEQPHARPQIRSMPLINRDPAIVFRPSPNVPIDSPSFEGDSGSGISGPSIPGIPGGDRQGMPNLFTSGTQPILPTPPPAPVNRTIRLSHISEGNLIRKVQPVYPALARSARIQGVVVLEATISKQGGIENLRLLSGHPMLAPSAIDAVRQWRYKPYILNGEPVEVETQITVNFALNN
jgi:periplasmic protein TonB